MDPFDANATMNRAAEAMRSAFFEHFPLRDLQDMTADEINMMAAAMAAIHCGELLDWAARFGGDRPVRETVMLVVDAMLADPYNGALIEVLRGADDGLAYLTGKDN